MDEPAVTTITDTGIDVFFNDVSDFNTNVANFFTSVSNFANNVINAVKSTFGYFEYVGGFIESSFNNEYVPEILYTLAMISLFFLVLNFVRNRGS